MYYALKSTNTSLKIDEFSQKYALNPRKWHHLTEESMWSLIAH